MPKDNITFWRGLFRVWLIGALVWMCLVLWYSGPSNLSGYYGRINAYQVGQIIIGVPVFVFLVVIGFAWIARGFTNSVTLPKIPENGWIILGILVLAVIFLEVMVSLALTNRI